AAESTTSGSSL
ncbi:hypothetical protein AVEN_215735-1, partial [Araneus ventricosus]